MKVSAIIPTYNRAYIVLEAVESVLGQTYRDFEIVVVDDGSTDNTAEIVRGIGDPRIRYITHEKNKGCSAAYNSGIAAARGDLVGFLDSDDRWKPDYLERQVGFFERHPEVDAVFTDTEVRFSTWQAPSLISLMQAFPKLLKGHPDSEEVVLSSREMYLCLLEEVPIKPSAVVVKRELFRRAGTFDEAWPSGTDWELFLRFSYSARFGFINRVLVSQQQTSDSTFLKFVEKDKELLLKVALREKRRLRNDPEALVAVNRGISSHCSNLAWIYMNSGKPIKSAGLYLRGFQETGEPIMLARAISAVLPLGVRNVLKRAVKLKHDGQRALKRQPGS